MMMMNDNTNNCPESMEVNREGEEDRRINTDPGPSERMGDNAESIQLAPPLPPNDEKDDKTSSSPQSKNATIQSESSQKDQGYGSMECFSNSQSNRSSSYSGGGSLSKSRNSDSSQSSGFGEQQKKKLMHCTQDGASSAIQKHTADTKKRSEMGSRMSDGGASKLEPLLNRVELNEEPVENRSRSIDGINGNSMIMREKRSKEQNAKDVKRKKIDSNQFASLEKLQISHPYSFAPSKPHETAQLDCLTDRFNASQYSSRPNMFEDNLNDSDSKYFTTPASSMFGVPQGPLLNHPQFDDGSNPHPSSPHVTVKKLPGVQVSQPSTSYPGSSFRVQLIDNNDSLHNITSSVYQFTPDKDQPTLIYTHALNYVQRIKDSISDKGLNSSPTVAPHPSQEAFGNFFHGFSGNQKCFSMILSTTNGRILQVSTNISEILGFPTEMVVGHSFIDFVYPKDSVHFSSNIITGMSLLMRREESTQCLRSLKPFYCRVRENKQIQAPPSLEVRQAKSSYKPCKITLKIKGSRGNDEETDHKFRFPPPQILNPDFILAEVIPVPSFYKVPDEIMDEGTFIIRHTAACNFSEYDPHAIPFLGHLPQDLTGNSIFDCYHPEDLPLLLTIYQEVIREEGKPYRSESYRFRTFNGSWVVLETEWLCFINPWTRMIDSIIGQHKVLKGPRDISIYMEQQTRSFSTYPEDVCLHARKAQRDIIELLSKPIEKEGSQLRVQATRRRRTLAEMMSCLVNDIHKREMKNIAAAAAAAAAAGGSCKVIPVSTTITSTTSTTASPIIVSNSYLAQKPGPYNASSEQHQTPANTLAPQAPKGESLLSSSESPSTYSRLNYSATLLRFFQSNPRTASTDASAESKIESSAPDSTDEGKSVSPQQDYKFLTAEASADNKAQYMSGYGSGSGDTIYLTRKYDSKDVTDSGSGECASGQSSTSGTGGRGSGAYRHVPLTEDVLSRHNQEMQIEFMERQKKNTTVTTMPCVPKSKDRAKHHGNFRQFKKSTRRSSSKGAMKRPCPIAKMEDCQPLKYSKTFNEIQNTHNMAIPGPSGMSNRAGTSYDTFSKAFRNSFHRSNNRPPPASNDQLSVNQENSIPGHQSNIPSGVFFPSAPPQQTFAHFTSAVHGASFPSTSSSSMHQQPLNSNALANHLPAPMAPVIMGPNQTHCVTPQGFAMPLQYMGGYPSMFMTPQFNHPSMYEHPPFMMPTVMMPHPSLLQQARGCHDQSFPNTHMTCSSQNTTRQAEEVTFEPEISNSEGPDVPKKVTQSQDHHIQKPKVQNKSSLEHCSSEPQRESIHQNSEVNFHREDIANDVSEMEIRLPKGSVSNQTEHMRKRTDSRATSVKVEPGSVLGSVASASGQLRCSTSQPPESVRSEVDTSLIPDHDECSFIPRVPSQVSHFSKSTSVLGETESVASPEKQRPMDDHPIDNNSDMEVSMSSPANDSMQLLSETSLGTNEFSGGGNQFFEERPVLCDPQWLDQVDITPQLLYRYQISPTSAKDVLQNDMKSLRDLKQPNLVDDQLFSLYQELDADGDLKLNLDEGITSSSGEEAAESDKSLRSVGLKKHFSKSPRHQRPNSYYIKQAIVHEVEAPMPPLPPSDPQTTHNTPTLNTSTPSTSQNALQCSMDYCSI